MEYEFSLVIHRDARLGSVLNMVRGPLLEACFVHLSLLYNLVFCIYKDNSELRPGNGNHRLFGIW